MGAQIFCFPAGRRGKKMIPLLSVFLMMLLLKSSALLPFANPDQSTSIALGFILVFAYLMGNNLKRLSLPQITGFILAGIVCGPFIFNFISESDVNDLQLLDGLALSLIALTAGGEMKIERLKGRLKTITSIVFFQTLMILAGFILLGFVGQYFIPFFGGMNLIQLFAFSLLLGTLMTPTSPATTIAVITETRSSGKYTDLILSTAVVKDFFIIVLFSFILSFSKSSIIPSHDFDFKFLLHILSEVGGSVLIGFLIGGGIILYLKFIKKDITIFILSVAFFSYQISHNFGFHPLLICLVAGFLAENFSTQGQRLINAIEKSSVPVYIVFFAMSGASLDIGALRQTWLLALVCVILRGLLKFSGTFIGASLTREEKGVRRWAWTGFVSQAGVALGMAIVIQSNFPDWGGEFLTLVLAIIAINQIIGPVLLQKLLIKVKEAGKKPSLNYS
jgi:Kef-type K+ transport system membrane component KefB